MFKKVLAMGLMLTVMLSASACGKEPSGASGTTADKSAESSTVESQPTEEETKDSAAENTQSTEEETKASVAEDTQSVEAESSADEEEGVSVSYIFSDMPIAAYEVTGLGVGLNEEVNAENIYDAEYDYDLGVIPLVKLDPSNTFTILCLQLLSMDEWEDISKATIHSPSGGSQWEANIYTCIDTLTSEIEGYAGGYPNLTKQGTYNEESYGGRFESLFDAWIGYTRFSEIYHPDAPQEDTIYVIQVPSCVAGYDDIGKILTEMVSAFEEIGAINVQEIPVEEALEKFNIIVSEEGMN